ncbi:hypothetical protein BCEN4_240024 [Burkholderia cenocepacia]|nr:hypothetical protein BCEN4_240024 [Burkholderia cenocepacia]
MESLTIKIRGPYAAHVDFLPRRPSYRYRPGSAPRHALVTRFSANGATNEERPHDTPHAGFPIPLGDRRRGRPNGLRRDRRDVLVAGVPAVHRARYGLVDDRHFRGDDARLHRDGVRQHGVGQPVGPRRHAPGRHRGRRAVAGEPGAGEPRAVAARVPADLRPGRGQCDGRDIRADDGMRDRLVRHAPQPRGIARVGRHGDGADDDGAPGRLARVGARLAHVDAADRRAGGRRDDPGVAAGAPGARARSCIRPRGACACVGRRARRDVGRGCAAFAAVHGVGADQFLLLRDPFGPDLPYGQLRGDLRDSADRRGIDLQRRRAGGHGRPDRVRGPRRSPRREAHAGGGAARAGARRARLLLRAHARRLLRGRDAVRLHLCGRDAAVFGARARELSAADDGHRDRRLRDGRQPRDGRGPGRWRADRRCVRQLRLAVPRLVRDRARRIPDRDDVPPVREGAAGSGGGVSGQRKQGGWRFRRIGRRLLDRRG